MNHRLSLILFSLFVIVHQPNGDKSVSYEGMDQPTITKMLTDQGLAFDFVDAATYAAFVLAHQPPPLTGPQPLSIEDRLANLEAAVTQISVVTNVPVSLPTTEVAP